MYSFNSLIYAGGSELVATVTIQLTMEFDSIYIDSQKPFRRDYELRKQSIAKLLVDRQTLCTPSPNVTVHRERELYQSIVPNYTEFNVQTPMLYIRKFTPDGNRLIAISSDRRNVLVYAFMGSGAGQKLYHEDVKTSERKPKLFGAFFHLRHDILAIQDNSSELLNQECSLFTVDNRYMITATSCRSRTSPDVNEDSTIVIIDTYNGKVTGSYPFKRNYIRFSHNEGISLYNNCLAVLSILHQTIHIFKLVPTGSLIYEYAIGRFCYPDDELVYNQVYPYDSAAPNDDMTFNTLQQRLMTYLYRQATELHKQGDKNSISDFYYKYDYILKLKICKMQMIDEKHLLLKYTNEALVTQQIKSRSSLFVFYNIESTEVVAVFENTSEELLKLYEDYADHFRNTNTRADSIFSLNCSIACNAHARLIHDRYKQTIINVKKGGPLKAVMILLEHLPISSQSYSPSPYLDLSLFSYDYKRISSLEQPKLSTERPIRYVVGVGSSCV